MLSWSDIWLDSSQIYPINFSDIRYPTDIRYIIFVSDIRIKYSYLYLILKKCLDIWKLCPNRCSPSWFGFEQIFSEPFYIQAAAEASGVECVDSYDQFDESLLIHTDFYYFYNNFCLYKLQLQQFKQPALIRSEKLVSAYPVAGKGLLRLHSESINLTQDDMIFLVHFFEWKLLKWIILECRFLKQVTTHNTGKNGSEHPTRYFTYLTS